MKKPNILFILSDQQRWDTLGCYGQKINLTPNLDQMAREGTRFENTFTCQPVCGPARACLQTGKYATQTGNYRNNIALPINEKTIARYFSENGYEVGYIGKWHLASTGGKSNEDIGTHCNYRTSAIPPERRGGYRDYWLAADALEWTSHSYGGCLYDAQLHKVTFSGFRADCVTDFALDYLRTRTLEKPFFLFLSYLEPHHQNDHARYEGPIGSKKRFAHYNVTPDLEMLGGDWGQNYPDYLGCCANLDENVGRIRGQLKSLGINDETVVFYSSDHGSHFKTRNAEYKRSCHEACIRIPLLACGPGFEGGKIVHELVSSIDIPPTLLLCADIEKPSEMQGHCLQKLLNGDVVNWPDCVFLQISESQVGRAIRTKRWKYAVRAFDKDGIQDAGSDHYTEAFLYDLDNDPYELANLVHDPKYRRVLDTLCEKLKEKMREAGEKVPEIMPVAYI